MSVRVRMYNVGFGDAYLLTFPSGAKALVDCGSIKAGAAGSMTDLVDQIVDDLAAEGAPPRLDVVVATHRHKDHVGGFSRDRWSEVEVGEVWLSWIEDPTDDAARGLQARQRGFAASLGRALVGMHGGDGLAAAAMGVDEVEARLEELADGLGMQADGAQQPQALAALMALNALSNERAMRTLHAGFAGGPARRFLARQAAPLDQNVLPGVTVHVLGPDTREEVMKKMDPPAGKSFFRAAAAGAGAGEAVLPFGRFELDEAQLADHPHLTLAPQLVETLRGLTDEEALLAATGIDSAVNNTSVMLMFEVGDAHLLFPGDAQWGPWEVNMEQGSATRALLEKTTFYKIGHHGSHNATPVEFAEEILPDGFIATASVAQHGRFTEIPEQDLMEMLRGRPGARVLRSDDPPAGLDGVTINPKSVDIVVPT